MPHRSPTAAARIDADARAIVSRILALPPSGRAAMPCTCGDPHQAVAIDVAPRGNPRRIDGGRLGIARDGDRVGLRLWTRDADADVAGAGPARGWRDLIVWIDANGEPPAGVLARCLLAAEGPLAVRQDAGGRWHCPLAAVTRLTGYDDRVFARTAAPAQTPESAPVCKSVRSLPGSPCTTARRWSESIGPLAMA